jgi:GNAT superfamily N-acetyltransferase
VTRPSASSTSGGSWSTRASRDWESAAAPLELLLEEARADGVEAVTLSVVPGPHSALGFYERFGFEPTGVEHGGETELRLMLD